MKTNRHKDLARHRMEKAARNLSMARENFVLGHYDESVVKSYYVVLTAMRALLALLHMDSHRHEGVIALFHQHLINEKLFPKDFNRKIPKLKKLREDADYGDFVTVSKEEAQDEIRNAEDFLRAAEEAFVKLLI